MKKNITSFCRPEWPKPWANKTGINIMIFLLVFVENCLLYDAIHDFSVWPRTGSNPPDINPFRIYTELYFLFATIVNCL